MLIAIDIGNTSISVGVLKGQRVLQVHVTEADLSQAKLRAEMTKIFLRVKREYPKVNRVVICSVVPIALKIIERNLKHQFKINPLVVGRNIAVPIKNKYDDPKQVGQDRLVGAYAAGRLYGKPAIIIDFGTAITFDVINKRGQYEGGIIVPGIRLSAESLHQKTALLPHIKTNRGPNHLIGKNTKESMLSGIFNGYGSLCSGLIDRISRDMKGKPKIILTGGHTHMMKKYIAKKGKQVDRDLVFKGLALLAGSSIN